MIIYFSLSFTAALTSGGQHALYHNFSVSRSCGSGGRCSEVWQPARCSTSSGEHIIRQFTLLLLQGFIHLWITYGQIELSHNFTRHYPLLANSFHLHVIARNNEVRDVQIVDKNVIVAQNPIYRFSYIHSCIVSQTSPPATASSLSAPREGGGVLGTLGYFCKPLPRLHGQRRQIQEVQLRVGRKSFSSCLFRASWDSLVVFGV